MSIKGVADFTGGITRKRILNIESLSVMDRLSGYRPIDGVLFPEGVTKQVTEVPLDGVTPEQTPAYIRSSGVNYIVARDKESKLHVHIGDEWSDAGEAVELIRLSKPLKLPGQIVFPTRGKDAKMMAFEPAQFDAAKPGSGLRPLSLKSPVDYLAGAAPIVTENQWDGWRLYENDDGDDWEAGGGAYSVTNAGTSTVVVISDSAQADEIVMKKKVGDIDGVSLMNARYMMFDIKITADPQGYELYGLFLNESLSLPSGYELVLYSDDSTSNELQRLVIPRMPKDGAVHRLVVTVEASATPVKSIAIVTSPYYNPPSSTSVARTLTVFSGEWEFGGKSKGNWLLPDIVNNDSPMAKMLTYSDDNIVTTDVKGDVLIYGGFEDKSKWDLSPGAAGTDANHASIESNGANNTRPRSGNNVLRLHTKHSSNAVARCEHVGPFTSGVNYLITIWYWCDNNAGSEFEVRIKWNDGEDTEETYTWTVGKTTVYSRKTQVIVPPDGATEMVTFDIGTWGEPKRRNLNIDDVSIVALTGGSGAGWLLQTTSLDADKWEPETPMARWAYCYAGRDLLSSDDYKIMISNPSNDSAPDVSYYPWTRAVITIPYAVSPTGDTVKDDYGDYINYYAIYRRTYDADTETWEDYKFVEAVNIDVNPVTIDDKAAAADPRIDDISVPYILELTNDYALSARHMMYADGRVYAGCLNWLETAPLDPEDDPDDPDLDSLIPRTDKIWTRPTAIEVSSWGKLWSYPTTTTADSPISDGVELDGYAHTGNELRGMISLGSRKFVYLDNEFFLLRGDNPAQGWTFTRMDNVGLISDLTLVECRGVLIWHSGHDFYAFIDGRAERISHKAIDSKKIDWGKPHDSVYCDNQYICFCQYDGQNVLLVCDIDYNSWRIRHSSALDNLVGITTDGLSVYGLTSDGYVISLFGSDDKEWTGAETVRDVWSQYLTISEPSSDVVVSHVVFTAVTEEVDGVDIEVTVEGTGLLNETVAMGTVKVNPDQSKYVVNCHSHAVGSRVKLSYTGSTPPVIYFIGVLHDERSIE